MKNRWIIGGAFIAIFVVILSILSLDQYSVYFYSPQEAFDQAKELSGKDIKVGGLVKEGSLNWKPEDLSLKFTMVDISGLELEVSHHGTPPDMFKANAGVVVEGRISEDGSGFTSSKLMVKHSQEYKVPGKGESQDLNLLKQSLFK